MMPSACSRPLAPTRHVGMGNTKASQEQNYNIWLTETCISPHSHCIILRAFSTLWTPLAPRSSPHFCTSVSHKSPAKARERKLSNNSTVRNSHAQRQPNVSFACQRYSQNGRHICKGALDDKAQNAKKQHDCYEHQTHRFEHKRRDMLTAIMVIFTARRMNTHHALEG